MIRAIVYSLILALPVSAQELADDGWVSAGESGRIVNISSQAPAQSRLWMTFNPPGSTSGQRLIDDILSHCTPQRQQQMISNHRNDPATLAHEATHMVNENIHQHLARSGQYGLSGYYVGDNCAAVLPDPKTPVSIVAQHITHFQQTIYYQNYVQRLGHQGIHFLLDEWSAAINGWEASMQIGASDTGDRAMSQVFCHFADCIVIAIQQSEPQYPAMPELVEYVNYQKNRVAKLAGVGPQTQLVGQRYYCVDQHGNRVACNSQGQPNTIVTQPPYGVNQPQYQSPPQQVRDDLIAINDRLKIIEDWIVRHDDMVSSRVGEWEAQVEIFEDARNKLKLVIEQNQQLQLAVQGQITKSDEIVQQAQVVVNNATQVIQQSQQIPEKPKPEELQQLANDLLPYFPNLQLELQQPDGTVELQKRQFGGPPLRINVESLSNK